MSGAQISLLDEIVVDGFCGGGGFSTGFEFAIGAPVDIGINHDADALESLRAENEHIRSNCYPRDGVEAIIRERDRFKAERDAAVKCIEDIYTYLCLGSEKYIARTIQRWMGAKEANHG